MYSTEPAWVGYMWDEITDVKLKLKKQIWPLILWRVDTIFSLDGF